MNIKIWIIAVISVFSFLNPQKSISKDKEMLLTPPNLPESWQKENSVKSSLAHYNGKSEVFARKMSSDLQTIDAEAIIVFLGRSSEIEASEMATMSASDEIKVTDQSEVHLSNGVTMHRVQLTVSLVDSDFGSPWIFHSLYLPQRTGGCVSYKLRCRVSNKTILVKEFEDMIFKFCQTLNEK